MSDKFVLVPVDLLKNIKDLIKGSLYEDEVTKILDSREVIESQDVTKLPKEGHVKRVIDGDTVELQNGLVLRYVGMTAPETGENFYKESTEENRKLVEDKEIRLEYDNYKSDKTELMSLLNLLKKVWLNLSSIKNEDHLFIRQNF